MNLLAPDVVVLGPLDGEGLQSDGEADGLELPPNEIRDVFQRLGVTVAPRRVDGRQMRDVGSELPSEA